MQRTLTPRTPRTWWIALTALAACAAPDPAPPSDADTLAQAVIRGTREPSLLSLTSGQKMAIGYLHQAGNRSAFFCTGTVIAPRLVATAKHCTEDGAPVGFALGTDPGPAATSVSVQSVYNHPQLDVSVMVLSQDILALAPGLTPIAVNRSAMGFADVGQNVEVGGFGETRDFSRTGRWFGVLSIAQVESTSFIVYGDGQRGFCFGDSGGPVLMNRNGQVTLAAVISATEDQTCLGYGFVERVDVLNDWMDQIAQQNGGWATPNNPPDPGGDPGGNTDPDPGGTPGAACSGSTSYCFNQTRVWCASDGRERREDCQAAGRACGFDANGAAACLDPNGQPPQPDPEPEPAPDPDPDPQGNWADEGDEPDPQGDGGAQWPDEGGEQEEGGWADEGEGWVDDNPIEQGWVDETAQRPPAQEASCATTGHARPTPTPLALLLLLALVAARLRRP